MTVVPLRPLPAPNDLLELARNFVLGTMTDEERYSFDLTLRHLTHGQKALLVARIVTSPLRRPPGAGKAPRRCKRTKPKITVIGAAKAIQINAGLVHRARTLLEHGTADEIQAVDEGRASPTGSARLIIKKIAPSERAKIAAIPRNKRGKLPERIQRERVNALIWRQFKAGLELADLPRPSDVAAIVRTKNTGMVLQKLLRAHEWLGEFIDEWTRPTD